MRRMLGKIYGSLDKFILFFKIVACLFIPHIHTLILAA